MVPMYKYFYGAISRILRLSKSFSSDGEDAIISKIFSDKSEGLYIDIGAYSPVRHSNTFRLYISGWHGILVEPTKGFKWWSILRHRDLFYNVGIDARGPDSIVSRKFYQYNDHPDNNTMSEDRVEEVKFLHSREPDVISSVQFTNIKYILDNSESLIKNNEIDLLNVDIEGNEFDVISEFIELECYPNVICVEELGNTCLSVQNTDVYRLLTLSGDYVLIAKTLLSSVYVRADYLNKSNSSFLKELSVLQKYSKSDLKTV